MKDSYQSNKINARLTENADRQYEQYSLFKEDTHIGWMEMESGAVTLASEEWLNISDLAAIIDLSFTISNEYHDEQM